MKTNRIFAALTAVVICTSGCIAGCSSSSDNEQTSKTSVTESSVTSELSANESSADDEEISDVQSKNESPQTSEQSSAPAKSNITPAVWQATDSRGNSVYMMGTIHVADKDALVLPDYFEAAYAKCDALAVECDVSSANFDLSIYSKYMYTDGTTIKDHVPEEQYNAAVRTLTETGVYMSAFDYMKPVMWSEYVELAAAGEAGLSSNYGIDVNMIKRAKSDGKELLELESVDFQLELLANLSDDIQAMLFEEIAYDGVMEDYKKLLAETYTEWKNGNDISEASASPTESSVDEETLKLAEEYNKILIDDRNVGMEEKIKSYMEDGKKVMVLAGTAHFYGEKGIISLLENDGYTIRKLTPEDAKDFVVSEQPSEIVEGSVEQSAAIETDPGMPRAA